MKKIIFGALFIFLGAGFLVIFAPVKSFAEPVNNRIRAQEPVISMDQAIEIFQKTYSNVEVEDVNYQRRGGHPTYFLFGRDQEYNRYKMEVDAVDGTILFHKKMGNYGNSGFYHNDGYGRGGCCY